MLSETDQYSTYSALLNQCDKEIDEIHHYYATRFDLSDAALWILYALYDAEEPVTQSDLCNYWFLSRQTIHTALNVLKRQKIIELAPIPGNSKSKKIIFTETGKDIIRQIIPPLKHAEKQVFAAFTEEENRHFVEMTQKRCLLLRQFLETTNIPKGDSV